jgi:hypothetical protein
MSREETENTALIGIGLQTGIGDGCGVGARTEIEKTRGDEIEPLSSQA